MKGGLCKAEFEAWDACVQVNKDADTVKECLNPTKAMIVCMRKHEYYDIMSTNSDKYINE